MKKAFIITVSLLSIVIVIMGIYLYATTSNLTVTTASLENLYQRSFYDLVDNVNNMEVEVSKLMVTKNAPSQQKILAKLKQETSDAENALSLLPITSSTIRQTSKFINQLNGYCSSLITYKEGEIEEKDFETLGNIYSSIAEIKIELNNVMNKVTQGYKISENLGNGIEIDDFSAKFTVLSGDSVEYPTMIYDGPFSESSTQKRVRGLDEKEIGENDAENLITKIFEDKITNLTFLGETKGKFETFDFGVNTEDKGNYFIQITKKGGFLLTISSDIKASNSGNVDDIYSSDDIVKTAENFAEKLGIENMKSVWSSLGDEVCYVNLAPVIDDIIMYPDLIKAKIDVKTKNIIGWEASSYAYNHIERDDLIPQLSEEEARKLVSGNLTVDSQRLCVIPLDFVGETLAYEFAGKYNDLNYYLYIDAYTGDQARVLRVVQTEQGDMML